MSPWRTIDKYKFDKKAADKSKKSKNTKNDDVKTVVESKQEKAPKKEKKSNKEKEDTNISEKTTEDKAKIEEKPASDVNSTGKSVPENPPVKEDPLTTLLAKENDRFAIIRIVNEYIEKNVNEIKLDKEITIPEKSYFKCTQCGNCCKNVKYKIPISITDMNDWINTDKKIYLRALDYNTGHPTNTFFFITKFDFGEKMIENHGKRVVNLFLNINPSLKKIEEENLRDCVFYNSDTKLCSIYASRPIHCIVYPYNLILNIDYKGLFGKAFSKISGMRLKDKDFINYMKEGESYKILCPDEATAKTEDNLKKIHQQRLRNRMERVIIGMLFSGSLYFKNRKDVYEKIMIALFSK